MFTACCAESVGDCVHLCTGVKRSETCRRCTCCHAEHELQDVLEAQRMESRDVCPGDGGSILSTGEGSFLSSHCVGINEFGVCTCVKLHMWVLSALRCSCMECLPNLSCNIGSSHQQTDRCLSHMHVSQLKLIEFTRACLALACSTSAVASSMQSHLS